MISGKTKLSKNAIQESEPISCQACHPEFKSKVQFLNFGFKFGNISLLSKYIKLSLNQKDKGFEIDIKNEANHTLFPQPLKLNQLRVTIERNGKNIALKRENFVRIIGKDGKPAMPWVADSELKNTLIKAHEVRKVIYDTPLKKGDSVVVEFGYYLVNPKSVKKLGITDTNLIKFIVLTKDRFNI